MLKKILTIFTLFFASIQLIGQTDYVLKCDFNDDDPEWISRNDDDLFTEIKSGVYTIQHKNTENTWYQYRECFLNPDKDFEIIMAVKQTNGKSNKGFGFIFGRKDVDNLFVFDIASTGYFTIFKKVEGKKENIVDWVKIKNVKPMMQENTLSMKRVSGMWNFYVNDSLVHSMVSQKTYGFYYGFYVSSAITLEVDRFYIKQKVKPINLVDKYESFGERVHLGSMVNTTKTEKSPVISADEKTLYFTRKDFWDETSKEAKDDIWYAELNEKDSTWGLAKNAGSPWNTKEHNSLVSISTDHHTAMLSNKYDSTGAVVGKGISISYKTSRGWSIPKAMKIKNYYNHSEYAEQCLSPDGSVLLVACQRDDSYGSKDIHVCFLQKDSSWSEPQNIGNVVNSFASEVGPFLAADGITLYFSSAGHPGYGSNDIFVTRRLDDTWKNWSEPKNLGPKVNTAKWDAYYTVPASGKNAYIISSTKGMKEDIYKIRQAEDAKPVPLVLVKGIVFNSETKQQMPAEVSYSELGSTKILGRASADPVTGMFQFSLPKGKKYSFHASEKGFISVHYNYDAAELNSYKEETIDLYLTPIKKGVSIVMNNLFFTANKYDILPESYPELDKLYLMLLENPSVKIEIGGHTSINTSGEKFNQELSTNRAAAVKKYLVTKGISDKRITSKGYSYSKPIYKTNEEAIQAKNRRVEFTIIDK
ncbi:MAG TPA: OmpA family protein [Bacteroidia bacterium]